MRALLALHEETPGPWGLRLQRATEGFTFAPSRFSYAQLVIASVFGLFFEMLMIRWVSSEVRIFAYFKNFVLIACFLGFGIGCNLCRRRVNILSLLIPLVLMTVLVEVPRGLMSALPTLLGASSEV